MNAGTGALARDTTWGRQGAAQFGTSDSDIVIGLAGKGLRIKQGSNARAGIATLSAGAVTIANNSVTANTLIILGYHGTPSSPGAVFVHSVTVGTGFVINSTSATDASSISWLLVEVF